MEEEVKQHIEYLLTLDEEQIFVYDNNDYQKDKAEQKSVYHIIFSSPDAVEIGSNLGKNTSGIVYTLALSEFKFNFSIHGASIEGGKSFNEPYLGLREKIEAKIKIRKNIEEEEFRTKSEQGFAALKTLWNEYHPIKKAAQ